jgi:hypothetical protein
LAYPKVAMIALPSSMGQWNPARWRGSASKLLVRRAIVAVALTVTEAASRRAFGPAFRPP